MKKTDKIFFIIAILTTLMLVFLVVYSNFTSIEFRENNILFKVFPILITLTAAWLQTRNDELPDALGVILKCSLGAAFIGIIVLLVKFFIIGVN